MNFPTVKIFIGADISSVSQELHQSESECLSVRLCTLDGWMDGRTDGWMGVISWMWI